jgi:spore maturation protein CgeB
VRVVMFYHSLLSDWNHGNAHFLRGIVSEFKRLAHDVRVWEPADSWSMRSLLEDHGEQPIHDFIEAYPGLTSSSYSLESLDLDEALAGADLVLVHEWNEPSLVARIGDHRRRTGSYTLLFHDTHHRSITDPDAMSRYDLSNYDGVLAFGESIADVYRAYGWGRRVWVWHEAADTNFFRPLTADKEGDLVWIGNWGDDERSAELQEFLIQPVRELGLRARVHGVRYPDEAKRWLSDAGIEYVGWVPNFEVPRIFARYRVTVHVPRRPYATALPGVPTIRIFEALACGIPLVSAPWSDSENLFTPGEDFLVAANGREMCGHLRALLNDPQLASNLAEHGRRTILARHTCAHRIQELEGIMREIQSAATLTVGGRN